MGWFRGGPGDVDEIGRPRSGIRARFRRILQLDDTPESIARGTALGMLVAMTPTVGIQIALVVIVNSIFRANRLAGVVMVQITNPLTMWPVYWLNYQIGRVILGQESIDRQQFEKYLYLGDGGFIDSCRAFVENVANFTGDVGLPLFLGGFIFGALCAIPTYPITLALVRKERALIQRFRERLASRRLQERSPGS